MAGKEKAIPLKKEEPSQENCEETSQLEEEEGWEEDTSQENREKTIPVMEKEKKSSSRWGYVGRDQLEFVPYFRSMSEDLHKIKNLFVVIAFMVFLVVASLAWFFLTIYGVLG